MSAIRLFDEAALFLLLQILKHTQVTQTDQQAEVGLPRAPWRDCAVHLQSVSRTRLLWSASPGPTEAACLFARRGCRLGVPLVSRGPGRGEGREEERSRGRIFSWAASSIKPLVPAAGRRIYNLFQDEPRSRGLPSFIRGPEIKIDHGPHRGAGPGITARFG